MKTVEDVLALVPSWGKYVIESYWHSGVVYGASEEVRKKPVQMIIAQDDKIMIYV